MITESNLCYRKINYSNQALIQGWGEYGLSFYQLVVMN